MNRSKCLVFAPLVLGVLLCIAALAAVGQCKAAITVEGGPPINAFLIAPPPSVAKGMLVGDAYVFEERHDVTLATDLHTDTNGFGHGVPGRYRTGLDVLNPGVIPAGTVISSIMIHFDLSPLRDPFGPDTAMFNVITDENIIGVILSDNLLDASDSIVGAGGTVYPTGLALRGATVDPSEGNDDVLVGLPGDFNEGTSHVVDVFGLQVGAVLDEVRIITTPPVPEPSSTVLGLTGLATLLGFAGLHPRRRNRQVGRLQCFE